MVIGDNIFMGAYINYIRWEYDIVIGLYGFSC